MIEPAAAATGIFAAVPSVLVVRLFFMSSEDSELRWVCDVLEPR